MCKSTIFHFSWFSKFENLKKFREENIRKIEQANSDFLIPITLQCSRPIILKDYMNSVRSNNLSLKYQSFHLQKKRLEHLSLWQKLDNFTMHSFVFLSPKVSSSIIRTLQCNTWFLLIVEAPGKCFLQRSFICMMSTHIFVVIQ